MEAIKTQEQSNNTPINSGSSVRFAKTLKHRREELGLSREQLAVKLGYKDRSAIRNIENGRTDIPLRKLDAFAEALGLDPASLIGCDPVTRYDSPVVELSDYERNMVMRLRALTDEQRSYIEAMTIREYAVATADKVRNEKLMKSSTSEGVDWSIVVEYKMPHTHEHRVLHVEKTKKKKATEKENCN